MGNLGSEKVWNYLQVCPQEPLTPRTIPQTLEAKALYPKGPCLQGPMTQDPLTQITHDPKAQRPYDPLLEGPVILGPP